MDINYLLCRQQISMMRAAEAVGLEAKRAHEGLARGYTARLRTLGFHALSAPAKPVMMLEAAIAPIG